MDIQNCPKCNTQLNSLSSSGRSFCPSCKWMERSEVKETPEKKNIVNDGRMTKDIEKKSLLSQEAKAKNSELVNKLLMSSNNLFEDKQIAMTSKLISLSGLVIMLYGGMFFDTTNCSSSGSSYFESCTHNIGLLNTRSNIVNIGGFLCVSGCVLFGKSRRD